MPASRADVPGNGGLKPRELSAAPSDRMDNLFVWWILGGLILMPVFLGMPAFAPLMMPEMQTVAMGSLMGHLIYGLILGATYVAMVRRTRTPAQA